jgi:hypothetical protein
MITSGEAQRLRFLDQAVMARFLSVEYGDDHTVRDELLRCAARCETLAKLDALRLVHVTGGEADLRFS